MERGSSLPANERMSENDVQAIDHLRDAYARLTQRARQGDRRPEAT